MDLVISHVYKDFGRGPVLRDVSLTVRQGETVCLMGPSGLGKTTLLRCVAGLERPESGSVTGVPERLGYVFQEDRLCENLNPVSNLRLVTPALSRTAAAEALAAVGLTDCQRQPARELSGGMVQKFLLANALALNPALVLLDEPTANLDYGNQFRLLWQVRALADSGYTVLLSTHNPEHAFRFATDVLVLREGGVRAFGPAAETLTEELLREIYRIPLTVADIPVPGGSVKGCVYDA